MKLLFFRRILPLVASIGFAVVSGHATPIDVINSSFENSVGQLPGPCGPGCSSGFAVPEGWSASIGVGLFQPGSSFENYDYFNYIPDGITVAFSNGGWLSQVVSATVAENFVYTLHVDWGARNDMLFDPETSVALVIGGTHSVLAAGILPTPGNWTTYTATYLGTAEDAGKSIGILLSSGLQGDWDNVRLEGTSQEREISTQAIEPVPEPASFLLLVAGLIGLAGLKVLSASGTVKPAFVNAQGR